MIKREAEKKIKQLARSFPAVAVIGPRQSGKTTLVRNSFPNKPYVLLEDPETRIFAEEDPRGFLDQFPEGAVIDEIQRVPVLFSYLQGILDNKNKEGLFILTGSQNFLLMEKITQSLAGRIAILRLLPLTIGELSSAGISFDAYEEYLFRGMYPRLYDKHVSPLDLYPNYVQTYLERDLRELKNVHNLSTFHMFLKMCAQRTSQILNLSSLANDCGITHNTVREWISLLETSFIIFRLTMYHKNFNKRLIKMPKIYFLDTGLASYLAGIKSVRQLRTHPLKGALFESFIMSELLKYQYNRGRDNNLYFWRDKTGHEIDCILEDPAGIMPIEVKSGHTITADYFKNIKYWCHLAGIDIKESYVIYGGHENQNRADGHVIGFRDYIKIRGHNT